jgi:hypothetical protein
MRHYAAFAFALIMTTILAHADVVQNADSMSVEVTGNDATLLLQAIEQQLGPKVITASYMACSEGFDLSPAGCSFSLMPAVGKPISGSQAQPIIKIYTDSMNLVYANPKNGLHRDEGDMIDLKKVDCSQISSCLIQFELPHPAL